MDSQNYVAPASGGGYVTVVGGKVVGNYPTRNAAENAFNGANGPTDSGAATTSTGGNGLTVDQMRAALQDPKVGYNGPWDDASVTAAYNRTVNGGNAGSAEAFNPQYYAAIQAGIDKTVANALAAANGQVSAAVDAANNIRGLIQTYGDQALGFLKTAGDLGVSVADVMSRLTGPANAFAYDRAATAFRGNGLGSSVQALTSGFAAPSFGAMGATSPMTLATMGQDVSGQTPGNGPGIIDQLLGLAGTAEQGYQNAGQGKVPFSIPQLDANGHVIPSTQQGTQTTPTATPAVGSDGLYQTSNGPKTVAQMLAELDTAAGGHWGGGDRNSATAIASAYAHTTGGTVTPPQTPTANQQQQGQRQDSGATVGGTGDQSRGPTGSATTGASPGIGTATGTAPGSNSGIASGLALSGQASPSFGASQSNQSASPSFGSQPKTYTGDQAYLNQYSPQAQQFLLGLPNPGDINPRNFNSESPDTQSLQLAGYSAKGYSPTELQFQLGKELPQSAGPRFGLVA